MTGYRGMYPLNQSLAEEIQRLFNQWCTSFSSGDSGGEDDVMADFKSNGHADSEYLPESDAAVGANPRDSELVKVKRKKKRLIAECVFCKKNGEAQTYYMSHTLKTVEGKILCPVLRAYTCPICGASGDKAHTIRYCPQRTGPLEMFLNVKHTN